MEMSPVPNQMARDNHEERAVRLEWPMVVLGHFSFSLA